MSDLLATIGQVEGTPTSESLVREHRVLIDRPTAKGSLDRAPWGPGDYWSPWAGQHPGAGVKLTVCRT